MNYSIAKMEDADMLDNLLTKLIADERINYDKTINQNFVVNGFYKNYIFDKNRLIYICKYNNIIVGYIYVYKENTLAVIDALYVEKKFRNKGLATKLLKYALAWIKDKKCQFVEVSVIVANTEAKKLYEKIGFKTFKETKRMEI